MDSKYNYLFRFLMLVTIEILLCTIFIVSAKAEDIYIYQTSQGSDTGFDCSNAHSASWFNTTENWGVGVGKISEGDTIHLCGTISTGLVAQASGNVGNPITILFEPGAKLSKGSWNGKALAVDGRNYITIDGGSDGIIENTTNGTGGTSQAVRGISAENSNNITIKKLIIRNMYVRTSYTDTAMQWNEANGIYFNGSNVDIDNNTIHNCGAAAINGYLDGATNSRFHNNHLYNNAHNYVLSSFGARHGGKFYFYNNYVHDYSVWDSSGCAYHNSGIHAWGNGVGGIWPDVQEFWIYNNKFENPGVCRTAHIFLEGTTNNSPWTGSTGTAYIYNNVAIGTDIQAWSGSSHVFYNNTVMGGSIATDGGGSPVIKNNYISGAGTIQNGPFIVAIGASNPIIDYNVYANATGYNLWCWAAGACTGDFATYKSHVPYDVNSINRSGTPYNNGGVSQITGNPNSSSDVLRHGVNLSSTGFPEITTSLNGVPRYQTAPWDIGAMSLPGRLPLPPTNVQVR